MDDISDFKSLDAEEPSTSASKSKSFSSFFTIKRNSNVAPTLYQPRRTSTCSRKKGVFITVGVVSIIFLITTIVLLTKEEEGTIYVHLVPHSHDDLGWLHTFDSYFSGVVHAILDHVVHELTLNSNRRFVYSETAFFWKWWMMQDEYKRNIVKKLVDSGQLQFVGGGWSMNDEAVTYYQNIIDQFTWGLRKLNDTFGAKGLPTVGWQIDTFGHSKEMASILAQIGFDAVIFARISKDNKDKRLSSREMEMIWEGSSYLGPASSIFTSIMYEHYNPPKGFHFEKVENEVLNDDSKINVFINYVRMQAKRYKSNHVLVPMGDDFTYYNAQVWFKNIEKLIKFVENKKINIKLFYSTPAEYIEKVNNQNLTWPTKVGDFMPLGCCDRRSYWSGFYTSRPALKYFERISNNFLQICKQLHSLVNLDDDVSDILNNLREVIGLMQHHDAITGTSKQLVNNNYVWMMTKALADSSAITDKAFRLLNTPYFRSRDAIWKSCLLSNISNCEPTKDQAFHVMIYNPLSWTASQYVRLPVNDGEYLVISPDDEELLHDVTDVPRSVLNIPNRDLTKRELVFLADDIPPLGFKIFHVSKQSATATIKKTNETDEEELVTIGNENLQVYFNRSTGLMSFIVLNSTIKIPLQQQLMHYVGVHHYSGAYKFLPEDNSKHTFEHPKLRVIHKGPLVEEIEQRFSSWASQIVRVYSGEENIEIEWLVGPIPNSDYFGREVISVFTTNISNQGIFYTDSNGRQMMKRQRNYREDWEVENMEPVAGNYYPITNRIYIEDNNHTLVILNDRAQGGGSIEDGQIELMLHRRLCYDDGLGVNEPLNETEYGDGLIIRGKHWVYFGNKEDDLVVKTKKYAYSKQLSIWPFFQKTRLNFTKTNSTLTFSGLKQPLPEYIHILTLEPWRNNSILLRLENYLEIDINLARNTPPIYVHLEDLFWTLKVLSVKETTLAANQWLSEKKRLVWEAEKDFVGIPSQEVREDILLKNLTISLSPMEIRTFVFEIEWE